MIRYPLLSDKYILLFPFCSPHLTIKKWPYYNKLIELISSKYGEEYKVDATPTSNPKSQGWMFDNVDTYLSDQLKEFVINASMSDELTGGGVETTDDVVEEVIPENFVKDLVSDYENIVRE